MNTFGTLMKNTWVHWTGTTGLHQPTSYTCDNLFFTLQLCVFTSGACKYITWLHIVQGHYELRPLSRQEFNFVHKILKCINVWQSLWWHFLCCQDLVQLYIYITSWMTTFFKISTSSNIKYIFKEKIIWKMILQTEFVTKFIYLKNINIYI